MTDKEEPKHEPILEPEQASLIPFPCPFIIKIMGVNSSQLQMEIQEMAKKHFPPYDKGSMVMKESAQGNYMSITLTIFAENKQMLDDFYREASSHPDIKMVL